MMKGVLNICAVFMAALLCVSAVGIPKVSAENNTSGNKSETQLSSVVPAENSYSAYIGHHSSAAPGSGTVTADFGGVQLSETTESVITVQNEGLYNIGMTYMSTNSDYNSVVVALLIDGKAPFSEAEEFSFPCMWQDEGETRADGNGNQFAAKQILYNDYWSNLAIDTENQTAEPYCVFLTAGEHRITVNPLSGEFKIRNIYIQPPESAGAYQKPESGNSYNGDEIIIEGENAFVKSGRSLSGRSDNTTAAVTPYSSSKSMVNYIGGDTWKGAGDTIVWETPELQEGYYQIGFSFLQNTVLGGKTYRRLTIDGQLPFKEAGEIGFGYNDNWQQSYFSNASGEPYAVYFSAGKHQIALSVVPGKISDVASFLKTAVSDLGSLYLDMTMITGETVDTYRDYDLFGQIPDMKDRLEKIDEYLKSASDALQEATGQKNGSHASVINNMSRTVNQMLQNRYTAHRYMSGYYDRYTALASVLYEMQDMPLAIDKISLTSPSAEHPFDKVGFFTKTVFSVSRFFESFVRDYNNISGDSDEKKTVTIWVNWGRDQAQVLNSLAKSSFTPDSGISVNVQLVNASIVQAVLSGKGPDCILQHSRSEPVNLAMRGVLYDLSQFDDINTVLERFQQGAEIPYRYKGGIYALPDTQSFFVMFYRKDVLAQLGLSVPETWDDFKEITNLLSRRNLTVWLPNNPATGFTEVNAGIGSINIFPSLLLQNGISLYSSDGKSTNLDSPDSMVIFKSWTDYYTEMQLSKSLNFYNRFRTGTCPIGISAYTLYTTLQAAAPEIDGLWGVAPIPGTVLDDGTISHASSGSGTACAIMKNTSNPEGAWSFLKWWTDTDTQLDFSNEVESILGYTGRVAVANIESFKRQEWDKETLNEMLKAWNEVEEIPEYPGSYYVSRSVYQAFWNVVESNENPKDMLLKYAKQADDEIARKWRQYENRPN